MIVTFGEALVDFIEQTDGRFAAILGGSVCNFALASARQGLQVSYLNPFSTDTFGQRFIDHLGSAGVQLTNPRRSTKPTSLAIVTLDHNKLPTYVFHRESVADRDIGLSEASTLMPAQIALFHTGGLALVPEDSELTLGVIAAAARKGALISVDANLRPLVCPDQRAYSAAVRHVLALAHLVKVSDEDLVHLGCDQTDPVDAARTLFTDTTIQLIALTLGERGAVLLSRSDRIDCPIPDGVTVVDTVGAGDSFWAGLIAGLQQRGMLNREALLQLESQPDHAALQYALQRAIASASLNVMRAGCNPPTHDEVDIYMQQAMKIE